MSFVKLPRSVMNDTRLSGDAVRAYAVMLDASRDGHCKISLERLRERLGISLRTAKRLTQCLRKTGHIKTQQQRRECPVYELVSSATGGPSNDIRGAVSGPKKGHNASLREATSGILRRRTYPKFNYQENVRMSAKMNQAMPGNELLEVLLSLGWPADKIKTESHVIWRDIKGRGNEPVLVREIKTAMANQRVRDPYAYALAKIKRDDNVPQYKNLDAEDPA
jgi:hypothetical protein